MVNKITIQNDIIEYTQKNKDNFVSISTKIFENPEVSNYEFIGCKTLSDELIKQGFEVKLDVAGHRTGFTAVKKSGKVGPVIAFLCEYDALANLGHACGHNLIGTMGVFAASVLSKHIDELGGEIRVYGTPGEEGGENGSSKESFVREGLFDDVDVALMLHPSTNHTLTPKSLAVDPVDIEFFGKPAHASGSPEKGINALDAIVQTYCAINALRQHVTGDVRIHGIITNGGDAPNIVPEYASARFYLRAADRKALDQLYKKVELIVQGAALCTGATGKITKFQNKVDNLIPTPKLDNLYLNHLESFGHKITLKASFGSTDAGNVSQVIPTLHASLKITDGDMASHTVEFKNCCITDEAFDAMVLGARLLSFTALDLFTDEDLLNEIKKEHKKIICNY